MTSLLKNQILKHISKFSKNLSPDKINLSTLKGEGELCNLELDENILTQLLDLPTWLQITKASVNKVNVKIQWTKLKTQPIFLMLDKVVVETETCEEPRPPNDPAHLASYRSGGKYGFTDRVIDGIYVHVESVEVKLISKAFHASLQLLRLKVQSTTPTWQPSKDLRNTRLRDSERDEIILFKEIEWQNVKIEANAIESTTNPDFLSTPLRLLANMSKIRITVKKKISDCSIISSRVILLVDDLLWVLTASQLKAAILYSNSLSEVIERSAKQSKQLAAEKLKKQSLSDHTPSYPAPQNANVRSSSSSALFNKYDVLTTSYHLITSRIDLHLCDDGTADMAPPPERTWNIENGAMQLTMFKLSVDYYPFHTADILRPTGGERKLWFRYADNIGSRNPWVQQLFQNFRTEAMAARKACGITGTGTPQRSPQHMSAPQLSRSPQHHMSSSSTGKLPASSPVHGAGQKGGGLSQPHPKTIRLLESCMVVKLEDFTIFMVSTPQNQRISHNKFFASDKKQLHLPQDMSVLHLEYTEYFFPDELHTPVPHANLYALLNPVRLTFDSLTLLWFNFFMLNLSQSLKYDLEKPGPLEHVDVKLEALMPRMLMPAEKKVEGQPDRPEFLQIQISKVCITNTRVEEKLTCKGLQNVLDSYKDCQLIKLPNTSQFTALPKAFYEHAENKDNPYIDKKAKWLVSQGQNSELSSPPAADESYLTSNTLKKEAMSDVWGMFVDQIWLEFLGALNSRSRPQPFVEALPVSMWMMAVSERKDLKSGKSETVCNDLDKNPHCDENHLLDKRPSQLLLKESHSKKVTSDSNNSGNSDSKSQIPNSNTPVIVEGENLADFHVIAKLDGKLRVQLNHFQYLFILRLSESLTKFIEQLNADFRMLGINGSSSFVFPLVVPEIEVAALCPCLMNLKCFPDDLSIPVTPTDHLENIEVETAAAGTAFSLVPEMSNNPSRKTASPTPQSSASASRSEQTRDYVPNVVITDSLSDSKMEARYSNMIVMSSDSSSSSDSNQMHTGINQNSFSDMTVTESNIPEQDFRVSSNSVGLDSGISMDSRRSAKMKSFSAAFSNWTEKLKVKTDGTEENLSASTEDLETISVKTDLSSDEDFEHLSFEEKEAPPFCHDVFETTSVDTYSDVADDSSSVYAESSSTRGKEIVSVVLFKLDMMELVTESTGVSISVHSQLARLSTCQPGNINTEDFRARFSGPEGFVQDKLLSAPVERFPIKFHYLSETCEDLGKDKIFFTVEASDVSLTFKMSSLTSLSEFLEDEKIPEPIPMSVDLKNLLLLLEEDRPSSSNPVTPGAVPMDIQIHRVTIRRGTDGVFHLSGVPVESLISVESHSTNNLNLSLERRFSSVSQNTVIMTQNLSDLDQGSSVDGALTEPKRDALKQLQTDNAALKAEVLELQNSHSSCESRMEELKNENDRLKVKLELLRESKGANCNELQLENFRLQQKLANMEEDYTNSVQERQSLLATLRLLQDDLMKSEQKNRRYASTSS